ncbi:MAG TPA: S9 family peptidase [Verrucomicrobiae bacterium]|nr:S9 family peptidase [Verrucomicrobiae bacterium]
MNRLQAPSRRSILVAILLLGVSACRTSAPKSSPLAHHPPVAKRIAHVTQLHGDALVDNYYWLREKDNPDVLAYLRAEDAYTDWFLKPIVPLRKKIYGEMLARVQEPDDTVPYRDGDWLYFHRTEPGKQYPTYLRKRASTNATEEILLDLNAMAEGKAFLDVGVTEVSDDGNLLAFTTDETGFRDYTLYVKDLRTGARLGEKIPRVDTAVWAADNQTLFYVTEDDAKRAWRVWRHRLGDKDDALLYEEKDALFSVEVDRSHSKRFVYVASSSKTADEVRFLRADHPDEPLKILSPRVPDREYSADDGGDLFYIRTNDKGRNFRLVTAPIADPQPENWKEIVPVREDVSLDDFGVFSRHVALVERANGLPQISVYDIATGTSQTITWPEAAYDVEAGDNAVFDTNVLRITYESLTTPRSVYDYDMVTHERKLLKRQIVKGGYDPDQYQTERIFATAEDGTAIPISLVYRKDLKRATGNPLFLYGYGSYGLPTDVWFASGRLSLLDRGVIVAIAHVRGGGEYGKRWHDAGKMLTKRITFTDFIACAETLVARHYTDPSHLAIEGGSAGGLLVGAVLNMRPELFHAAVLQMPFVDVINTMLDESLPLTVGEFEEWGNPKIADQYRYMKSYSPYDNIQRRAYPAMLVESSLNDSQVMYWEPAKYVAKLRAARTDSHPLLLKMHLQPAGHNGESGRYDAIRDTALEYAFILTQLGIDQ